MVKRAPIVIIRMAAACTETIKKKRACMNASPLFCGLSIAPGPKVLTSALIPCGCRATLFKMAESNAAFAEVVGGHLYRHLVSSQDTDVVLAHLSGCVGNQLVTIFQIHTEARVRKDFGNKSVHFKEFFFSHGFIRYQVCSRTLSKRLCQEPVGPGILH